MTERVNVTPRTVKPGQRLAVDGWCLEVGRKYQLVTVDSAGTVTGWGQNGTWTNPDGSFSKGIPAPVKTGDSRVELRRGNKTVAAFCPFKVAA